MSTTFATMFAGTVDGFLLNYVSSTSAKLSSIALPFVIGGLTLYTMVFGFAILRGDVQQPIGQWLWKMTKIIIIVGVGLGVGSTQTGLLSWIWSLQSWFGATLAGSPGGSTFVQIIESYLNSVDQQCTNIIQTAAFGSVGESVAGGWTAVFKSGGIGAVMLALFTGVIFSIVAALILAAAIILAACAMLVFLSAKIALAAVLAVAPLFFATLCFDKTAKYFDSWLSAVLNYIFVAGFTGMVLGLSAQTLTLAMTATQQLMAPILAQQASILDQMAAVMNGVFSFIAINAMCIWFFFQCPSVASTLVGGGALSHPVGSAMRVLSNARLLSNTRRTPKSGGTMDGGRAR